MAKAKKKEGLTEDDLGNILKGHASIPNNRCDC